MAVPYDIRKEEAGWTVFEVETGHPAIVNDYLQVGLSLEDADDLADLLNHLATEAEHAIAH